jgi:hypothetical protein
VATSPSPVVLAGSSFTPETNWRHWCWTTASRGLPAAWPGNPARDPKQSEHSGQSAVNTARRNGSSALSSELTKSPATRQAGIGVRGSEAASLQVCMKPQPESSTREVLAGLVERVTFHNAENGFCVLRAKARGHRDLVTVVGHAATISAGEWVK